MTANPPDSRPQDAVELARKYTEHVKSSPNQDAYILAKAVLDKQERIDRLMAENSRAQDAEVLSTKRCREAEAQATTFRTALEAIQAWWKTGDDFDRIPIEEVDAVLAATPPTVLDVPPILEDSSRAIEAFLKRLSPAEKDTLNFIIKEAQVVPDTTAIIRAVGKRVGWTLQQRNCVSVVFRNTKEVRAFTDALNAAYDQAHKKDKKDGPT